MPLPITRRAAVLGLGLSVGAAALPAFGEARSSALNFLAVGDWGRGGEFHQSDVAARMGETAAAINAGFVISVGDNFYEDGVASADDPQWKTSFEDIYTAPSLQVPWWVALGNHDYRGDSQAQIDYGARSRRWRMPDRRYSFSETAPDATRVDFFIIDTSPMVSGYWTDGAAKVKVGGQDVKAQLEWFDAALAASRADWKIVVGHHPIWPQHPSSDASENAATDVARLVDPLLRRHGVHLYLNGHDHDLQHVAREGVHYVCTGAGSKMRKACDLGGSDFCDLDSGFVAVSVDRSMIRVAYRDYKGVQLRVVDIARP